MDDKQRKAIEELIRVARVAAFTARGMWHWTKRGSAFEAAAMELERSLDAAAEAAYQALHEADLQTTEAMIH